MSLVRSFGKARKRHMADGDRGFEVRELESRVS